MERKNRQGKSSAASTPGSGPKKPAGPRRVGTGRSTSRTIKSTENREGQEDEKPYRGRTAKESTFSADNPRERKSPSSRPERTSSFSDDKPRERKSPSSRPERTSSFSDDKPRERKSPSSRPERTSSFSDDKPRERKSPSSRPERTSSFSDDKPRERKSPSSRPERTSSFSDDKPRERKSPSSRPERESSRTGTRRDFKPRPASDSTAEGDSPKKEGYPRKSSFKFSDSRERKPSTFKPGKSGGSGTFKKDFKSGKPGPKFPAKKGASPQSSDDGLIRLNKYISNSGVCSRREADELILAGIVTVNGIVVTELGTKISPDDKVQYDNQTIKNEKHVYVLLNKPKGYITTTDDPFDRKTVMSLVADACKERIYPVGRLDRNTTGLLLLTNDGDMAKKLTHPRHKVKKVYQVELDKALTKNDMLSIAAGVELEDGLALIDEITYISDSSNKKEIGVELHSGKNRIVRRIFEASGYEVVKLDRVIFAGLTKKDLPRGKWRLLTEQEINYLKMLR